jgi:hypothetical protein
VTPSNFFEDRADVDTGYEEGDPECSCWLMFPGASSGNILEIWCFHLPRWRGSSLRSDDRSSLMSGSSAVNVPPRNVTRCVVAPADQKANIVSLNQVRDHPSGENHNRAEIFNWDGPMIIAAL